MGQKPGGGQGYSIYKLSEITDKFVKSELHNYEKTNKMANCN